MTAAAAKQQQPEWRWAAVSAITSIVVMIAAGVWISAEVSGSVERVEAVTAVSYKHLSEDIDRVDADLHEHEGSTGHAETQAALAEIRAMCRQASAACSD